MWDWAEPMASGRNEVRALASHRGHTPLWASGLRDNKLPCGLNHLELRTSITWTKMTPNRCRGVCSYPGGEDRKCARGMDGCTDVWTIDE